MKNSTKLQSGSIVPTIIIFLVVFTSIGSVTLGLISSNYFVAVSEDFALHAQLAADAGADVSIQKVNSDPVGWLGTSGTEQVVTTNARLKTTYETLVTPGPLDKDPKTIEVIGRSYSPDTATEPRAKRTIKVVVRGIGGGGTYSVVTGVGGLSMVNSAKITEGDVYVNGGITMKNTSQIGSTARPVNVRVANARCPLDTNDVTFPSVCGSGINNNPIQMFNSARIYGDVQARNQLDGSNMLNNGLIPGDPPLASLPTHDRIAQKAAVAVTRDGGSADAGCNSNGATRTWAANTKIIGNVVISKKCKITVEGDVWITGNLSFDHISIMKVKDGLANSPVIMIDGPGGIDANNTSVLASNNLGKGFRVITYWSAASCGADCTDVKGADYQNSKNVTTIRLDNSASGPNTEFYARWSAVTVGNSGDVGAVVGQTVNLTNSAAVTFGAEVSSMSQIPSTWVVQSYRRM